MHVQSSTVSRVGAILYVFEGAGRFDTEEVGKYCERSARTATATRRAGVALPMKMVVSRLFLSPAVGEGTR